MNSTRFDTLFSIRYAVRVLERYARMWHRLDVVLRVLALFSGTSAFAALMGQNTTLGGVAGALFALIMCTEYVLNPPRREQEALKARALYADVLSRQKALDDDALEQAYQDVVKGDTLTVPEPLRRLAYNDVTEERGCDLAEGYRLSRLDRAVSLLA